MKANLKRFNRDLKDWELLIIAVILFIIGGGLPDLFGVIFLLFAIVAFGRRLNNKRVIIRQKGKNLSQ